MRESTFGEINTHKHTVVSQAVSSPLMKRSVFWASCPSRDARIPKRGVGEGWARLCILITVGKFLGPLLACCCSFGVYFPAFFFFFPYLTRSHERVQHGVTPSACSGGSLDRKRGWFFFFFPRMYIKASYASGGISAGDCRDSPREQDDDIAFIVFFFSPLALPPV